jgi:hypothetical protein
MRVLFFRTAHAHDLKLRSFLLPSASRGHKATAAARQHRGAAVLAPTMSLYLPPRPRHLPAALPHVAGLPDVACSDARGGGTLWCTRRRAQAAARRVVQLSCFLPSLRLSALGGRTKVGTALVTRRPLPHACFSFRSQLYESRILGYTALYQ